MCAVSIIMPVSVHGQVSVPVEPILRLNSDMHTAGILRVDTDAAERLAVTGSYDKTARIWDLETGALRQILRVPIAVEDEGQIRSVALSPDGATTVIGGRMRYGGDSYRIFFFDVGSGQLIGYATGFGGEINDLEWSPDGRYIAVATGGTADLAIVNPTTQRITHRLTGYGAASHNVAWASDGRLATTSYDGNVRLYDALFNLTHMVETTAGDRPHGLSFCPLGSLLAVGFEDTEHLQVFHGVSLEFQYQLDDYGSILYASLDRGACATPSWSPDGKLLYGAGRGLRNFGGDYEVYVRAWEEGVRGNFREMDVTHAINSDIRALSDERFLIVSNLPELALIETKTERTSSVWRNESEIVQYNNYYDRSHLRVNDTGISFGAHPRYSYVDESPPFLFNVADRRFVAEEAPYPSFSDQARALEVSNWRNTRERVEINGVPLSFLKDNESSQFVSVSLDGSVAVLTTQRSVYGVNPDGSERWQISGPEQNWGVNVAANGRVFVAAYGDGTVRWHRTSDGQELLAFFLHADRERWVLWTPSGYYDASPGGEELIGWHVNRGIDGTPDFYPASTFRDRFYRPDIVQEILVSYDEETAVAAANQRRGVRVTTQIADVLPPTVRIVSPRRDVEVTDQTLTVELQISTADDAPVTDIQVRVNGRPQHGIRGLAREDSGSVSRITVDLSRVTGTDAFITVQAANRHGIGPAADVRVRLSGRQFEEFAAAPKLYVFAVGVSTYRDSDLDLMYAAKDARDVTQFLKDQEGGLYREVEVRTITDQDATLQAIRDGLFWLEEQVTANDVAKIFIAGHGMNDNTGQLHFAPYDVDVNRLRRTGLPATDIVDTVSYLQGRVVYFMDACHSGNLVFVRRSVGGVDLNRHIQDLSAAETGAVVFSSAAGSQFALESDQWGNGAFTRAMLEGLGGAADFNSDGAVSVNELNLYVSEEVKQLTNNQQTPVMQRLDSIRDFPLATVRAMR